MKNVKQEFTIHEVVWVKPLGNSYWYCLTDNDPNNKSGQLLRRDNNYFDIGTQVKLTNTLVPSNETVSGWLRVHAFLEAL